MFFWKYYCYSISTHDLTRRSTKTALCSVPRFFISTHDLTRRSTYADQSSAGICHISTHDLTRRSTRTPQRFFLSGSTFQLTTSRGGRLDLNPQDTLAYIFQLTTSRGGRPGWNKHPYLVWYFNSRPHEEVDGN